MVGHMHEFRAMLRDMSALPDEDALLLVVRSGMQWLTVFFMVIFDLQAPTLLFGYGVDTHRYVFAVGQNKGWRKICGCLI